MALSNFNDQQTLAFAKATNLKGLITLNMHRPAEALEYFDQALGIRLAKLEPRDSLITWGFNNLGLAYTELPDLEKALSNHEKALEVRLRANSDRIGNSYSNLSSLFLRMGKVRWTRRRCTSANAQP